MTNWHEDCDTREQYDKRTMGSNDNKPKVKEDNRTVGYLDFEI